MRLVAGDVWKMMEFSFLHQNLRILHINRYALQLIPFAERQVKQQHHVEMTTTCQHDHNANQGNADEDLKIVKVVKKLQDGE